MSEQMTDNVVDFPTDYAPPEPVMVRVFLDLPEPPPAPNPWPMVALCFIIGFVVTYALIG